MPLDWLNSPIDANVSELLARKKRAKAIETLRRQLQGRLAPPVAIRLQLADLLMQAGRVEEAVPVLLGLADEFAGDGFVAKAVAILKRVDRVQPGRPDVGERLENLVRQQKSVAALPSRPRSPVPEIGIEEFREEAPPEETAEAPPDQAMEAPLADAAASAETPAPEETIPPADVPPPEDAPSEAAVADPEPVEILEAALEPDPADPAAVADVGEEPALLEVPPSDIEPAADEALAPEAAEATGSAAPSAGPAGSENQGVGRRIRRALWRFLASLPGAAEGAPPAAADAAPLAVAEAADATLPPVEPAAEPLAVSDATLPPAETPGPDPSEADLERAADAAVDLEPEPSVELEPEPSIAPELPPELSDAIEVDLETAAPAPPVSSPSDSRPLEAAPEATEPTLEPAPEPMTEDVYRDQLLDIVEDVLHRPVPPASADATERARVLDLARRLVASRLFRDLSDEELLAIVRGLRLRTFEPGDIVVTEGEPGQSLFTLTTGRVRVFVANPDHRNFEVAALGEGDFFGEISSLSGLPRTATVVAATTCELLELDRPTLDSIARTHARVRDVLESSYIARASNPEAAAVRAVSLPDAGTRRKAIEVLEAHFGESRWDPRMRLRLADVLLKAGKHRDAVEILVGLADDLAREGFADKAVAILKKIEQVQRRNVEVVNLAPLLRPDVEPPEAAPPVAGRERAGRDSLPARRRALTDDRFHGWLLDLVRDSVAHHPQPPAPTTAQEPALKAYGPGLLANPLFEGFSEEELVAFIHGLRLVSFEPGDVIITEGEAGQSVFILANGRVKVFVRAPDHRDVRLAELGEGSFVGEISTLSGRPRSATVTAAAPCDILELDRAALDAISARHPRVRSVLETYSTARSQDAEAVRARGLRASD